MEKKTITEKRRDYYKIFLIADVVILIASILIPYSLILLNHEINHCNHHITAKKGNDGDLWIWGRALGFTTLIWFLFSSFNGWKSNAHAKLFHSKKKAKNYHCINSLITNIILGIHVLLLVISEPWYSLILKSRKKHSGLEIFLVKLWMGIIFGVIMVSVSLLSVYLRDMKKLKKFGYKRFIWVHRIMLLLTVLLAIHIILINTELWIMGFKLD